MSRAKPAKRKRSGFTLPEVMITMFLISMMCLSVFAGLQQITKSMMAIALRSEAYHLVQAEAERLLATDFSSFASSADQTITSSLKTSYSPSNAAALAVGSDTGSGRISFTRRVVEVASTATSKTLRVEVRWTWQANSHSASAPLHRTK